MDVTTTSTKIGKFDARFFHMIFEEEFAKVSNDINARLILGSFDKNITSEISSWCPVSQS